MEKEEIIMPHDYITRAYNDRLTRIQHSTAVALKHGRYLTALRLIAEHRMTMYRRDRMTREINAAACYISK